MDARVPIVLVNLGDAIGVREAGDWYVGFRQEVLLVAKLAGRGRGDPEPPPLSASRMAPNTLGESKRGRKSQSTDPSRRTRAALCMFPTMPWFSIGW
jgi:hypothetical protein